VLNGQYLGKHTWFYPTGEKEQVIEYRNGVAEGKVQLWYIDGKLRKSTDFTKGQPNGKQIEWYKSGVKMSEQDFVNATKHGEFKYWGKDERLLERKVYEEGRVVKAEDYNSASLRLPEGYAYVFNLLNSNFVLKMIGNKVEPVSTDGLAFYVDGSIVQYFTVATSEFKGEQETIDDTELWKRFLEDEKNRVEYQLDTTVEIRQKAFVLKNGKAEGVFWSFDLPEPITKGKLKIVQEQYIALKVQNYIVQINGFVLNETKPEKLEAELAKILETIEIMDKPIDIIEYVKNAVKY
jgi:antitoxin component YwqK of YwqJK toxin-antitoxin module